MARNQKVAADGRPACDAHEMDLETGECPGDYAHCLAGQHCTWTTASCAAELAGDDHPTRCCACKEDTK